MIFSVRGWSCEDLVSQTARGGLVAQIAGRGLVT